MAFAFAPPTNGRQDVECLRPLLGDPGMQPDVGHWREWPLGVCQLYLGHGNNSCNVSSPSWVSDCVKRTTYVISADPRYDRYVTVPVLQRWQG